MLLQTIIQYLVAKELHTNIQTYISSNITYRMPLNKIPVTPPNKQQYFLPFGV